MRSLGLDVDVLQQTEDGFVCYGTRLWRWAGECLKRAMRMRSLGRLEMSQMACVPSSLELTAGQMLDLAALLEQGPTEEDERLFQEYCALWRSKGRKGGWRTFREDAWPYLTPWARLRIIRWERTNRSKKRETLLHGGRFLDTM